MSGSVDYLDTSALVKLIRQEEVWGRDLLTHLAAAGGPLVSSALARTELLRAVFEDPREVAQAERIVDDIELIAITTTILDRAGRVGPASLRSLDAIHTATALSLGSDLRALIAYDERMIQVARAAGLPVLSPGRAG
ncbi:MAG TPA: type II toxin-antitoxin system VapC family toxin [Candidatus Binatia bacterium]|jgi:predicted nucleic acid-binding protein|nr:type II toxin-antitoxin system VapC family toxin [Candidatus Binatia bacterium]